MARYDFASGAPIQTVNRLHSADSAPVSTQEGPWGRMFAAGNSPHNTSLRVILSEEQLWIQGSHGRRHAGMAEMLDMYRTLSDLAGIEAYLES